ncbi:ABC transporter permease [Pseudoalteromonas obscura]|uniref:ABC transporter permease n=1 Tax=Pseudoalteromonas obscura TaxID=3048491 RepID=A0ABT7EH54_9GAMM|nr:ABC transporter permease [Pseudoalteromonas sp. P94(2023)]MDK2594366.1 ABC transporter permease [Pseudoalteromonas sp. P94(2023)]
MKNSTLVVKQSIKSLSRKPTLMFGVIATLGLTLGAFISVLTLAYYMFLKPLPYPDQERLVTVEYRALNAEGGVMGNAFTYPGAIEIYKNNDSFDASALMFYATSVMTSDSAQPTVATTSVTPEWFDITSAKTSLGRVFTADEGLNSHIPLAVLSHKTWQEMFNSDEGVLDQSVSFNGISYKIVGVLSPDFIEPRIRADQSSTSVWLTWDQNSAMAKETWSYIDGGIVYVAKVKAGVTADIAAQQSSPRASELFNQNNVGIPFFKGWSIELIVTSLKDKVLGDSQKTVTMLVLGAFALLLIAMANITNLFISRTIEQHRKLAINAALGAKKSQLHVIFLLEATLLMLPAAIFGLVIAYVGIEIMQAFFTDLLPRSNELSLNFMSVISAFVLMVVLILTFSRVNLSMINYKELRAAIQSSGKGSGLQVSQKTRSSLMVAQIAIASIIIFATSVLFSEAYKKVNQPLGMKIDGLVNVNFSHMEKHSVKWDEMAALLVETKAQIERLPQVESVTFGESPLSSFSMWAATDVETNENFVPIGKSVDSNYFNTLDISFIEGKGFDRSELNGDSNALVVNQGFARLLSGNDSALGKKLLVRNKEHVIVGVIDNIMVPGAENDAARLYVPIDKANQSMLIKIKDNQTVDRTDIVNIIYGIDSKLAVFEFESLAQTKYMSQFGEIVTIISTLAISLISTILAGLGLYGVLNYTTQMNKFELGTRLALGSKRKQLILFVFKNNLKSYAVGVSIATAMLIIAYLIDPNLLSQYIGFELVAIGVYTLALILAISWIACYVPLRPILNRPLVYSLKSGD